MVDIDIAVEAGAWDDEPRWRGIISEAARNTMSVTGFGETQTELSILLTDDAHIADLNHAWRSKDGPTNVLSFPAMDIAPGQMPGPLLGDVVLAFETVEREARRDGKRLDDHVTHLVVHGILHLLGYDHEVDIEAETMENLEKDILAGMGIADPYQPHGA